MNAQLDQRRHSQRFTLTGLALGIIIAIVLFLWVLRKSSDPTYSGEGLAFNALGLTVILGAPLNIFCSVVVDWMAPIIRALPDVNEFHVMLLGVIANWTLLGWLVDRLSANRGRSGRGLGHVAQRAPIPCERDR